MAELCVQERLERSRSAWGLQRARRLALVIMPAEAPSRTSQTRELFNAVRRYLPGVAVWLYTSGELLPLTNAPAAQAAGQSEAEQSVSATQHDDEEPSRSSPATRPEPQPLHLSRSRTPTAAPRPIEQAVADERGGEVESDDVDRVTAEELHMLFERDGSEEPP
jgi:hypothetical protein